MRRPKVSVVMSTYNHVGFVRRAIESVLHQSFQDFEFLITDDGSRDGTAEVIAQSDDPKIRLFPGGVNRGAAAAINELIERSSGDYVAVLNSDDFWPLDKLEYQVNVLDEHPEFGAMFGDAFFVDETEAPLADELKPHRFDQPNRSPGMWLRQFFDCGNCLCHPTVLIRRQCYSELGTYDNRLRQLPDFDMWVRLVKRYSLFVSDRVLVYYRWGSGDNVSAGTPETQVRTAAEHALLAEGFFAGVAPDTLRDGFGDLLILKDLPTEAHLDIETAFLYFRTVSNFSPTYRAVGLRKLAQLLASEHHRELLDIDYGFGDLEFQRLSGVVDIFAVRERGPWVEPIDDLLPHAKSARRQSVPSRSAGERSPTDLNRGTRESLASLQETTRLHVGAGPVTLAGWLNTDIEHPDPRLRIDLRDPLPYGDSTIDFIFSEHVMEHLTRDEGLAALTEWLRVLHVDGVVRLCTPDMRWVTQVYMNGLVNEWTDVDWIPSTPCQLLNEGMRAWDHRFLYDADELVSIFREAGFRYVRRVSWRTSTYPELCGLESRPYHHELIFEARKTEADGHHAIGWQRHD